MGKLFAVNSKEVYVEQNENEYMVYVENEGMIYMLNKTAGEMLSIIKETPFSLAGLVAKFSEIYPTVNPQQLAADLLEMIEEMITLKIIDIMPEETIYNE